MSQPESTTRFLLLIATLTNPFCWLPCIQAAQSAPVDIKNGTLRGTVFVIDSDGSQSVVKGATVRLNGNSLSIGTTTDERGNYSFHAVAPASYQIEAKAPGLVGSQAVTVVSGAVLDVPVQLRI